MTKREFLASTHHFHKGMAEIEWPATKTLIIKKIGKNNRYNEII